MPGRMFKYEELSAPEIDALDFERTAVFLAVSPIEGHGPHLPLGVDYFDAIYFAEKTAELTLQKKPDFDVLIYPAIPLGTQLYKQPGSVRIKSVTLYQIVFDIGVSLAMWGFKYIFLLSGHGSPKDIVAIESACVDISKKRGIQMHNLSGALAVRFLRGDFLEKISAKLANPLSDADIALLKKDIHGGWWETSMMLYLKPDLVKDNYKTLSDNEKTMENTASNPGYYGSPSKADVEFAKVSVGVLIDEVGSTIDKCLSGIDIGKETVSPLHKIRRLRPKFKRHLIISILAVIKSLVICWLIYKYFIR